MSQIKPQFQTMNREQFQAHLLQRAARDTAFRDDLAADPRRVIEEETGLQIPSHIQVSVVQETADKLCLVLPSATGELSDLELEAVAGGSGSPDCQSGTPNAPRPAYRPKM